MTAVRAALGARVWAIALVVLALSLLLAIGPMLDVRRQSSTRGRYLGLTAIIAVALVAARTLVLSALTAVIGFQPLDSPLNILVTGLALLGLVGLATSVVERRRLSPPRPSYRAPGAERLRLHAALYFAAGIAGALIVGAYERFLQSAVTRTHLDVLHFSLHPIDLPRFAVGFGLILMHAAVIWGVALLAHTQTR